MQFLPASHTDPRCVAGAELPLAEPPTVAASGLIQEDDMSSIAQRIRDWFQGERANHGYQAGRDIADEVDAMIASAPEPLSDAAAAWKEWTDYENSTTRERNHGVAMDLCKYAEWCADVELGLTTEPFQGVPRIVLVAGNQQ